jgi:hypothetical protein
VAKIVGFTHDRIGQRRRCKRRIAIDVITGVSEDCGGTRESVNSAIANPLAKATYAFSFFVRLDGHRGSFTGARQLVGHKGGVFKRLFDRNFYEKS